MNSKKVVLDLCGGSGAWSRPYVSAGYDVRRVSLPDQDVRYFCTHDTIHGILAAPPCTEFCIGGARHWKSKDPERLVYGLSIVDACLRIVAIARPQWWCLENPVGRLRKILGAPRVIFQPYEYGDPYTKRTCLWGDFQVPIRCPVPVTEHNRHTKMLGGKARGALRSITPAGFAQKFFESNP